MITHQVISPITGSAANTTNSFDTNPFLTVVVSAPGLAGAEEVDIYVKSAGGYALFGSVSAVFKLTATIQSIELPAGPTYAFVKDATVGAVGVYLNCGSAGA